MIICVGPFQGARSRRLELIYSSEYDLTFDCWRIFTTPDGFVRHYEAVSTIRYIPELH